MLPGIEKGSHIFLKGKVLCEECLAFQNLSDEALQTLRQKGLWQEQYLACVDKVQNLAEGMFQQPAEEMALLWRIERNAQVKEPSLDERWWF